MEGESKIPNGPDREISKSSKQSSGLMQNEKVDIRSPTFVSSCNGEELQHAQNKARSSVSPGHGEALLTDGEIRHVSPHSVNLNQFYPQIEFQRSHTDSTNNSKDNEQLKASSQLELEPPIHTEDIEERQEEEDNKEDNEGVFPTQVDEEVLEAAKERQRSQSVFETDDWNQENPRLVSLQDVLKDKAREHYTQGMDHFNGETYDKAIMCLTKAINLKPKVMEYYVCRAEAFLNICDFQSAILNYKRVCVAEPENTNYYNRLAFIYYLHGQCLFDQKLYPEALEAFSRAAEMRPEVIGYHTRSIACLAALERHGECLALVNKRLEVEQDNADLYVMRARLHKLFKNTTLGYYDVKDALMLDPEHVEARSLMELFEVRAMEFKDQATHLHLIGRHRDAMQKVSIAIETNPSVADFHVLRGALHRRLSDFNAAIDDYLLALDKTDHDEENPTYMDAQRQLLLTYNDFAVECFTKGFFEEAIILLNKAIKGEKREKGLYVNRGDCFFKEGQMQFSMADYQQALELDPNDASIRARIAVLHNEYGVQEFQDKNYKEAERRFTLAVQHNPCVAEYYLSRCRSRQMMENVTSARQDVLMALLLDPSNPELVGILTRLFPGKSVKDVMASRAAHQARVALENLVVTASPVKLSPISSRDNTELASLLPFTEEGSICGEYSLEYSSNPCTPEIAYSPIKSDNSPGKSASGQAQIPVKTKLWGREPAFPSLRSCMEEKNFNIRIAREKQLVNGAVKKKLTQRQTLSNPVGRIQPIPPSDVPVTRVPSKRSSGWKNFTLGIGGPV